MRIGESRIATARERRWKRSFNALDPAVVELREVASAAEEIQAEVDKFVTGLDLVAEDVAADRIEKARERGSIARKDVSRDFAEHVLSFIDPTVIKPFIIAIDAGNGMAGRLVPQVMDGLDVTVDALEMEAAPGSGDEAQQRALAAESAAAESCFCSMKRTV